MKKLFLFLLILVLIAAAARADVVTITVTDLIASGKTGEVYTSRIIDEFWDGEGSSSFSSGMDSDEYKLSYAAVNGNPVEKSRTVTLNHSDYSGITAISIEFMWKKTAATTALRNGMPMEQVKEFLGHSNINTTMIYAKLDKADIKRSHEKYLG